MVLRLVVLVIATTALGSAAQSQQPAALRFEVASIKRNLSDTPNGYVRLEEGSAFNMVNAPIALVVLRAFGLENFQIANLPDWTRTEHYDIRARAANGVDVFPNMAPLLRSLLQERFSFQAHMERREMPTYDLLISRTDHRLGPRVSKATLDCGTRTAATPPPTGANGEPLCEIDSGPGRFSVRGYSMARFAQTLALSVHRIVVDKTGLAGGWNLDVLFTPEQPAVLNGAIVPPNPDAPSLFTAVQEQLGLKLEASRGLVDVLVVDRLERPTED